MILRLKPGREKSLLRRHPWVFSGAVEQVEGRPEDGDTVAIHTATGEFLAWGAYSSQSQIRARVWCWEADEKIEADFFRGRLKAALALRRGIVPEASNQAGRLVHGESDGLPGLVVDRYADTLVMQVLSSGAERWRWVLADLLLELTDATRIYERSDVDVRQLEGLPRRSGLLRGRPLPERVLIEENGLKYWVEVAEGHKTGFYLDQRQNRQLVASLCREGEVLDCFCYTGGFSVSALAGGAKQVLGVDASAAALALRRDNLQLNGLPLQKAPDMEGDVFQVLRRMRDARQSFDVIILDPPKFAQTESQAERAARGYKDINLLAFKLLRPGGYLATFSCSGGVSRDLFQKIIAGAALDAGVEAQIVAQLSQAADHPVALNFPEGAYLKGLIVRKAGQAEGI